MSQVILARGVVALYFSNIPISIASQPSALISDLASFFNKKGNDVIGNTLLIFSSVYIDAVITVWCGLVLVYVQHSTDLSSAIPLLFWSNFVALRRLIYESKKYDQEMMSSPRVRLFFAQLGYFVIVVLLLLVNVDFWGALTVFGTIMLIGTLFNLRFMGESTPTVKKFLRKELSTEESMASAKTLSQATQELITMQLALAKSEPADLLTNDVLPFFLGYVWGFSDCFAQYFAESANKKYDQSISATATAQVLEQLFGAEHGEHLFDFLWTLSGPLFDIGRQRGTDDVGLFVTKQGGLSLAQFLTEQKPENN